MPEAPLLRTQIKTAVMTGQAVDECLTKHVKLVVGPITVHHQFILSRYCPVNVLGWDQLCKLKCTMQWSQLEAFLESRENCLMLQAFMMCTDPVIPQELRYCMPLNLWARCKNDMRQVLNYSPGQIKLIPGAPLPLIPQYKISKEGEKGIAPVIKDLLQQGIIKEICSSPCTTPILLVKKVSWDSHIPLHTKP